MRIGKVLPKCPPVNMVEDCEYIFPMSFIESFGYLISFMMDKSLAWSMEPKAFLKSL